MERNKTFNFLPEIQSTGTDVRSNTPEYSILSTELDRRGLFGLHCHQENPASLAFCHFISNLSRFHTVPYVDRTL
jgi:hypothetical protein